MQKQYNFPNYILLVHLYFGAYRRFVWALGGGGYVCPRSLVYYHIAIRCITMGKTSWPYSTILGFPTVNICPAFDSNILWLQQIEIKICCISYKGNALFFSQRKINNKPNWLKKISAQNQPTYYFFSWYRRVQFSELRSRFLLATAYALCKYFS